MTTETITNEQETAIAMSREILQNSRDINGFQTATKQVKPLLMCHIADAENGIFGVRGLIIDILKVNGSTMPKGCEKMEMRAIAIASAMFTSEILAEVQRRFSNGSTRYPLQTIKNELGYFMEKKGLVVGIRLTKAEDKGTGKKARVKWYLPE